jgi:hypothetical protein
MKKSHYLVLVVSLIFFGTVPSCQAASDSNSSAEAAPITEADFGTASAGGGLNTTEYSINPNTAYDNMNILQTNTSAAGTQISDYYSTRDDNSAASQAVGNQSDSPPHKNIPIGRGLPDTSRGLPTPGAGLPSTMTGSLATTLANQLDENGKLKIQDVKHYTFGFTGTGAPTAYALNRGIALPAVSTGSIIMDTGFTPR